VSVNVTLLGVVVQFNLASVVLGIVHWIDYYSGVGSRSASRRVLGTLERSVPLDATTEKSG
jgi:hypothetical protein